MELENAEIEGLKRKDQENEDKIRKNAQQKYLGVLIKFHHRIKQLEQCKSSDEKLTKNKAHYTVPEPRVNVNKHEEKIENIQKIHG